MRRFAARRAPDFSTLETTTLLAWVIAYPERMSFERISIDPNRMQGLPCIRGTRVTVSAILGQLAAGRSIDEVLEDYGQLEREDVLGALEYAAAATREREIPLTAAG